MTYFHPQDRQLISAAMMQSLEDGGLIRFASRSDRDLLVPEASARPDRMRTFIADEGTTEVWHAAQEVWVGDPGSWLAPPNYRDSAFGVGTGTTAGPSTIALAIALPRANTRFRINVCGVVTGNSGATFQVAAELSGGIGFLALGSGISDMDPTVSASRANFTIVNSNASVSGGGVVIPEVDGAVFNLHVLSLSAGSAELVEGSYLSAEVF